MHEKIHLLLLRNKDTGHKIVNHYSGVENVVQSCTHLLQKLIL